MASEATVTTRGRVVLLAGVPGAGKTSFGAYLAASRGGLHIDVEESASRRAAGFDPIWDRLFRAGDARAVVDFLGQGGRVGILDWGFPIACLPVVEALVTAGAEPWWFDGDRAVAFARYRARPFKNDPTAWRNQVGEIDAAWNSIERLFDGHVLQVVSSGPTVVTSEAVAQLMNFTPLA